MFQFRFVSRLDFVLSWCLLIVFSGTFRCLLDVQVGVPVDVQTVRTTFLEEKLFEVLLQLLLSEGLEEVNIGLLSVELVLVRGNLNVHARKFLHDVLIFLGDVSVHCPNDGLEMFICHRGHLCAHLCNVNIKTAPDMLTVFGRRLNEEPGGDDISGRPGS